MTAVFVFCLAAPSSLNAALIESYLSLNVIFYTYSVMPCGHFL